MNNFLNKNKFQLLLFFIVGLLFIVNYQSGTYLSGWDNLQTELNPELAVKRAFFSVWEEYQSFGLTAGMAHATDLVRATFLWVVSFLIPQNIVRYFYHFLLLLLGGLGMMRLLRSRMTNRIAFLGAIFYMLNLGTVQMFYLSFEAFSSFFAFLPWAIWSFMKILNQVQDDNDSGQARMTKKTRNIWLHFIIINFLGTPAFYTQALFAVYLLVLGCVALGKLLTLKINNDSDPHSAEASRGKRARMTSMFILILIINSFWILPQLYFLKTKGSWITQAKANQIATERTYYQNLEKGTFANFLKLEGFYFDSKAANSQPLFLPWKFHFSGWVKILPNFFAFLMILGIYESIRKKKFEFIFIFIICSSALLSATPPFSWADTLIRKNSLINQVFRSPFTKFIIPYSLVYSYFVSQGISKILKARSNIVSNLFLASCFLLIIFYSFPSFRGFFISPEMKVKIPNDYLQLITYFKNENKNKRIALLPDYTFWGWFFHRWGYNGSGFLWYGIEQPIISRTFDVWSPASESYFWEQKQIIESEDLSRLETVYEKYNIDYILIDYSLIPVVSNYKSLQYDRIDEMFRKSKKIALAYQGENIALYKFNHAHKITNFIALTSDLTNIGPESKIISDDSAYSEIGIYKTDNKIPFNIYYPFLDLTSQTRITDKKWRIEEKEKAFSIISEINPVQNNQNLFIPANYQATILNNDNVEDINLNLTAELAQNNLNVSFEKKLIKTSDISNLDYTNDIGFNFPDLSQKYGYLIKIRSKNSRGLPLTFYIVDETKKQTVIEGNLREEVEYFILPPKFNYGVGYTIVFSEPEYKIIESQNLIEELSIYLFPYRALKSAKIYGQNYPSNTTTFSNTFQAEKLNYFTYKISLNNQSSIISNLLLYQAFDPGWIALANGKILNHFLVNNWANAWRLSPQDLSSQTLDVRNNSESLKSNNLKSIVIIFWPQYLEFLGFILLIGSFFWIMTRRK